jgi:hypothetical protein
VALEQAGISLEAQNFNKYIKQLDTIDKAQQEIFDVDSKDVTKAFNSASKAADNYSKELRQVETANQKIGRSQQQFAQGLQGAAAGLAAFATGAVVQFSAESAKLAAQFQGQQTGLENLAAAAGQSGSEIQAAIQSASKGTISGLDAIQAANAALLFGVAKTPEEFSSLTKSAVTLGRTLGLDATQSIEQFTTALGRQSLLILDNFGISAKQVNAEIERLAQADFGKARSELTEAQKQATFMKAALAIAGEAAATIGDEAGEAQASFDRLSASSENLQVTFGALIQPVGVGLVDALSRAAKTAQQLFAVVGAGAAGVGSIIKNVFSDLFVSVKDIAIRTKVLFTDGFEAALKPSQQFQEEFKTVGDILDEASIVATERFKDVASTIEGVSFPDGEAKQFADAIGEQSQELEEAKINLDAYQSTLRQAENLQLSFARAAEDSALRLARANEDIARKQGQQVAKLEQQQAKDRDKLLKDQTKRLDQFEKGRRDQIARAESDIAKARKEANEQRKRDQEKLQRELRQAEEKFNLSQLQASRRFDVQSRRLRAEGDILALQQLREDRELEQQEEKENFALSQKERKQSGEEQQREQAKDLERQLSELKTNLEDQRAELLASFDEQLAAQREAQQEAQLAQRQSFIDQGAERAIQLQREEEDRRISQARQLEDLGRSFAEQEGVTQEGTTAVADQLETVFGVGGTADNIMTGFTSKTKGEFTTLFKDLEKIIKDAETSIDASAVSRTPTRATSSGGGFGGRIGGVFMMAA